MPRKLPERRLRYRRCGGLLIATLTKSRRSRSPTLIENTTRFFSRFAKCFDGRTLETISTEELADFVVELKKSGMSANTVLHNVVIIAQFCKRNGRPGLTRLLHLPEKISSLPREYSEQELANFFAATTDREKELSSTTGGYIPLLERYQLQAQDQFENEQS